MVDTLLEDVRRALEGRTPRRLENPALRPAGVLVPFFEKYGEPYLLLTRRSEGVQRHQGQIAFPGGCWEPEDSDLFETALRECEEEIGLSRRSVERIGALDDHETVTGFRVSPFVGVIPHPYPFRPDPREIQDLIEVPLSFLMAPESLQRRTISFQGKSRSIVAFPYGEHDIWGATAEMIEGLVGLIRNTARGKK
jgi:8-oxo-dGTP pyrophosphatase MutT (NUDIX family)